MRGIVVIVLLMVMAFGALWIAPAFREPSHGSRACDPGEWGFDMPEREWECEDHWIVRLGDYGIGGV